MILEEFDKEKISKINPNDVEKNIPNFPSIGITCFSKDLIDRYVKIFNGEKIAHVTNTNGEIPIYKISYNDVDIALFMSAVGAPACVVEYEEITALGLEKLIMFGTCGSLDNSIKDLAIIIPTSAIRDEGTSYHYMESSNEIEVNKKYRDDFIHILNTNNVTYKEGKVWTTDALYRETENKILKRKSDGCICVDMECSAINAVANFRDKELFQFFYAADNLDSSKWDIRSLANTKKLDEKEKIIYLALELAVKMYDKERTKKWILKK